MGSPSIDTETYRRRRALLVEQTGEGVAIVPGARLARRAGDVGSVFRQHSDLLYPTGFDQPQALAVLTREKFVLLVQPRDPAAESGQTPEPLRGIGVRIGDDLLVTDTGREVLTRDIPKRLDDVEAWMRQQGDL